MNEEKYQDWVSSNYESLVKQFFDYKLEEFDSFCRNKYKGEQNDV